MDPTTIVAAMDFARQRLLTTLDTIEASGQDMAKVLAWRPGPGRAHIAWQAMHCAASHDRYLNVAVRAGQPRDAALVSGYAGGSTPVDGVQPNLATIRATLARTFEDFRGFAASATPAELSRVVVMGKNQRSIAEALMLLTWHEAHHQGQIHLTWNIYKATHGVG